MATSGNFSTASYKDVRSYKFYWEQDSSNPLIINWWITAVKDKSATASWYALRGINLTVSVVNTRVTSASSVVNTNCQLNSENSNNHAIYKNQAAEITQETQNATLHYVKPEWDTRNTGPYIVYNDPQVTESLPLITGKFTILAPGQNTARFTFTLQMYTNDVGSSSMRQGVQEYSLDLPSYTVTYNANGGSGAPDSQTKYYNTALVLSGDTPTKKNAIGNEYTVTFNGNSGTPSIQSATATDTIKYTFAKWNTKPDGSGYDYQPTYTYSENSDVILYAIYSSSTYPGSVTTATAEKSDGSSKRTVTLNANGGECDTESLNSTAVIEYTCKGWFTSSSGGTKRADSGASYTPSQSEMVYAQWDSTTGDYSVVILPIPTRKGYKFLGWAEDSESESGATGNYVPSSDVTLYAIWEALATMFRKVNGKYKAGIPYVKVNGKWKKAISVYTKVNDKWKFSAR